MTHEKDAQSRRACRFQNELYADYYLGAILYLANDADLHVVHKQSGASWVARVGEVLRNLQSKCGFHRFFKSCARSNETSSEDSPPVSLPWNLGLDELRKQYERLLPAEIATLERNSAWYSFLHDVQFGSAGHLFQ